MTAAEVAEEGAPTDVPAAALDTLRRGFIPIPLRPGEKRPIGSEWQRTTYADERQLLALFDGDTGVGVRLGDGLADVDIDSATALRAAPWLLPATPMRSGRASSPSSHWWFAIPGRAECYLKITGPSGESVVELRATPGHQTAIPPTMHPSGELYEWFGDPWRPAAVELVELRAAVASVGVVSILADAWPGSPGSRNDAFMAVAGGLLRGCADHDEAVRAAGRIVSAIARLTGDEEARVRARETVPGTVRKLRAGELPVTGWTRLGELLDPPGEVTAAKVIAAARSAASLLRDALGLPGDDDHLAGDPDDPDDAYQQLEDREYLRLRARNGAAARWAADQAAGLTREAIEALTDQERAAIGSRFRAYSVADVRSRKIKPDMVEGLIAYRGSLNEVDGTRGSGKSLASLAIAAAVACGLPDVWGLPVREHGPVLYVYREGVPGPTRRLRAWEAHHERHMTGVTFVHDPINLREPEDVRALALLALDLGAVLVILDPVARTGGGAEDAEDFGTYRAGIESLRDLTGASVLVLHNAGLSDPHRGRGHSTLTDGMDSAVAVVKDRKTGTITIEDTKSRDSAALDSLRLVFTGAGDLDPVSGRCWSGVLTIRPPDDEAAAQLGVVGELMQDALECIDAAGPEGATSADLAAAIGCDVRNLTRELRPLTGGDRPLIRRTGQTSNRRWHRAGEGSE